MFNYLFPIFAFGLVITGVVFLGLQQASEWARDLAEQNCSLEPGSMNREGFPPGGRSTPPNPPASLRHP